MSDRSMESLPKTGMSEKERKRFIEEKTNESIRLHHIHRYETEIAELDKRIKFLKLQLDGLKN